MARGKRDEKSKEKINRSQRRMLIACMASSRLQNTVQCSLGCGELNPRKNMKIFRREM